jgi:ribose 1,5-bisphosphokinase
MAGASSNPNIPIGPGRVVLVVGPSGAGKDTLIAIAREKLGGRCDIIFPKRFVTREPSAAEDNFVISPSQFAEALPRGQFALHWRAHGICYGIGADIDDAIQAGVTVVINISRSVVADARHRYTRVDVAYIDAPAELRLQRIAQRGRETSVGARSRLPQASDTFCASEADIFIVNDREPAAGGQRLFEFLAV